MSNLNFYLILNYIAFCLLAASSYAFIGDEYALSSLLESIESTVILILIIIFFRFSYFNGYKSHILIIISTILAIIFNIIDLILPGEYFEKIEGFNVRAAGFYINANNAALAIVLGLTLTIKNISPSYRIPYIIVCLLGILATFSRGGLVCWLFLYTILMIKGVIPKSKSILILFFIAFMVTFVPQIIKYLSGFNDEIYLIADRLDFFSGNVSSDDVTDDARFHLLRNSFEIFVNNPLLGQGSKALLRSGFDQLSHNQFLELLADYGLLGFTIYLALLSIFYIKLTRYRFAILLIVISSFFTHNIFDSYIFIIAFAYLSNIKSTQSNNVQFDHVYLRT